MSAANLTGRTALVTGAGRGIGAAVAGVLADAGARLVLVSRTATEIESIATRLRETGADATAIAADVTDEAAVASVMERAGDVDVLVHAAGSGGAAPLEKLSLTEWNAMLASHATSAFLLTREAVPGMKARGFGRIVLVASSAGLEGARYIAHYAAAKHAVVGLVRSVACELEGSGVTLHALCPGYVDTPMTRRTIDHIVQRTGRGADEALDAVLAAAHQSRLLAPSEVASAVLSLLAQPAAVNGRIESMVPGR